MAPALGRAAWRWAVGLRWWSAATPQSSCAEPPQSEPTSAVPRMNSPLSVGAKKRGRRDEPTGSVTAQFISAHRFACYIKTVRETRGRANGRHFPQIFPAVFALIVSSEGFLHQNLTFKGSSLNRYLLERLNFCENAAKISTTAKS